MPQKHMTKKELKEDPFFEEVAHIIEFLRKHQTLLIVIVLVLALGFGGFFGSKAITKNTNEKASGYFGIGMDYYNKGMMTEAEDQFMLLAEQYKRSDWGKRAYYYLGQVSRSLQKSEEESLDYLETFVNSDLKDPQLKASAYQLIGTYYYRNGDMLMAGDNYMNAAKKALSVSEKINLGIRAGEAYIDANDSKKLDALVAYLGTLDLNDNDQTRVKALVIR